MNMHSKTNWEKKKVAKKIELELNLQEFTDFKSL